MWYWEGIVFYPIPLRSHTWGQAKKKSKGEKYSFVYSQCHFIEKWSNLKHTLVPKSLHTADF